MPERCFGLVTEVVTTTGVEGRNIVLCQLHLARQILRLQPGGVDQGAATNVCFVIQAVDGHLPAAVGWFSMANAGMTKQ